MSVSGKIKTIIISIGCLFWGLPAQATWVLEQSLEDLARKASVVVYGRVVQIEVDPGTGYRSAIVEANEVAKAPEAFRDWREFYVGLVNRAIPHSDLVEITAQAPELILGEEVLLFLDPVPLNKEGARRRIDGRRIFALSGFFYGKNLIFSDSNGARRVATARDVPAVTLSARALQLQRSSRRLKPSGYGVSDASLTQLDLQRVAQLRTLDEVLNLARGAQ